LNFKARLNRRAFLFHAAPTSRQHVLDACAAKFNQQVELIYLMQHWLVKSEPEAYAWETFLRDKRTAWTGVRNFAARNHLRAMRKGDQVLFYESVTTKAVLGVAEVAKEAFADTTAEEGDWSAVELKPVRSLPKPVTLEKIKAEKSLASIMLVRQGRLSVMPLKKDEFETILQLGSG
jgi:predicted RNA-binding protein with PUA-like domain